MLVAVHIADIMDPWWVAGGFVVMAGMLVAGLRRMREEEVARTGVITAVLYVATLIHPPIPGAKVHLLLNGIAGILLGIRAGVAVPLALLLQALIFSHGGKSTLGVNSVTIGVPALLASLLFVVLKHFVGLQTRWRRWLIGGLVGSASVLLTLVLYYVALRFGATGDQDLQRLAQIAFVLHVPVLVLETILTALLVDFLYKIRPGLLGAQRDPGTDIGK
jgi:cobalt/nickel transport system permease protein